MKPNDRPTREPRKPEVSEYDEKVIQISRVSKKTKGGNKMGFSVLMVVGDKKGKVGVGLGKAQDVISAVRKGVKKAKKKMINVPLNGTTIPFKVLVKRGAGKVMLKPAPRGSGVIAGGAVRAVVEAAGVRDISTKVLGSENQASSVYATFAALREVERLVKIKGLKLRSIAQVEEEEAKKMAEMQEQAKKKSEESEAKNQDKSSADKPKSVAKKPAVKKPVAKTSTEKKTKAAKPAATQGK